MEGSRARFGGDEDEVCQGTLAWVPPLSTECLEMKWREGEQETGSKLRLYCLRGLNDQTIQC